MTEILKCDDCAIFNHFSDNCINCLPANSDACKENFYSLEALNIDCADVWADYDECLYPSNENKKRYLPIKWLINWILRDSDEYSRTWFVGVCFEPRGQKQDEGNFNSSLLNFFFRSVWVDQFRNGGYTGDDFAGNLYYRIFPFVYLCFGYEC